MEEKTVVSIINQALMILEKEVGLAKSSLRVVASRSFKPINDFFINKNESYYNEALIIDLEELYQKNLQSKIISRNFYNVRMRGTRILREINNTGTFLWKGPASKKVAVLSESNEHIVTGVANANISKRKNQAIQYVVRSFLLFLADLGINDISQVEPGHIQSFLSDISKSQAKSMDHVISSLRKMDRYLIDSGVPGLPYAGLLMAPRAREGRIYPCMSPDDMNSIIGAVDRSTLIGKRDYAILLLAAACGIRTGDIANIKLSDIDWRTNEIRIIQGKTQAPLSLPLQKEVGAALADYILNGRPKTKSPQLFIRSIAPFQGFADGVSVACILRRRMKAAGVTHVPGDGKTMHGIRRMFGTQMIIEGVPVTTVAQILGHQNSGATRPYISLDIEGLRECALGFGSLMGGGQ